MKIMKVQILLVLLALLSSTFIGIESHASGFLTEEKIEMAHTLASNGTYFEDYVIQQKQSQNNQDWLTLEEFSFDYKNTNHIFSLANGFYPNSNWGEIAVYPIDVDPTKIYYSFSAFNDLGRAAPYLATLRYEYKPSENSDRSYFIVEKVSAGYQSGGKGYSQVCLKYFVDEFVTKRTDVNYLFSDLRDQKCQHYFPRYGFQSGVVEEFINNKFERPLQIHYSWVKH